MNMLVRKREKEYSDAGCNKGKERKKKIAVTAAGEACRSEQSILILQIHAIAVKSIIC